MSRIVGIDPGASGALALIIDGRLCDVLDMPESGHRLTILLETWRPDRIYLEDVHCNGKNGSKANWSLGYSKGLIEGVVSSLRHPLVKMSPQSWKQANGLIGKDKEASRQLARELFPRFDDHFKFKKNVDRAEAALIARAGVMHMVREFNESDG